MLARVDAAEGRMSEARRQEFGLEAFLVWEADQPQRWELIDGRLRLMTGRTQAHWLIAGNVTAALRQRMRGSPRRPGGSDPLPAPLSPAEIYDGLSFFSPAAA